MNTKTNETIKRYMIHHAYKHLDSANCLCMTSLAEDAADEFGDNNEGEEIPDYYFELAHEVHEYLERKTLINS